MKLDLRPAGKPLPVTPDKHSIIPIHQSDVAAFKRCRRFWDWSSPMRNNLTPKPGVFGINTNLWLGTGVHLALEQYYQPPGHISRDPVEVFTTWFHYQWFGGFMDEGTKARYCPNLPVAKNQDTGQEIYRVAGEGETHWYEYLVDGLRDILPDPIEEEFFSLRELGVGMLLYYRHYAEKNDNFAIIASEHDFSIPLRDANGRVVRRRDPRDGRIKQVHARGRMDAIVQDLETGQYGIMDHKTAAKADGEDYARKLEKDEQCSRYMWAAEQEAMLYDLEYKDISFVLYNTLWKVKPEVPEIVSVGTKSFPQGRPSTNRSKPVTPASFMQAIVDLDLHWWLDTDDKAQDYAEYLLDSGDDLFLRRDIVTRNKHEIYATGNRIRLEVADMLDSRLRIYPNPSSDWRCTRCSFRAPCIARDDGSDWQAILDDGYQKNYDR